MNAIVKLSTKGQFVIPKPVRDRRGWRDGTEVELVERGDEVVLRAVRPVERDFEGRIARMQALANYRGPYVPEEDWDAAIEEMFRARGKP